MFGFDSDSESRFTVDTDSGSLSPASAGEAVSSVDDSVVLSDASVAVGSGASVEDAPVVETASGETGESNGSSESTGSASARESEASSGGVKRKSSRGLSKVSEESVKRLISMGRVVEADESHVRVAQELSGSRSSDSGVLVAGLTGRKSVERVANVLRVVKLAVEGDSALAGALVSVEFLRDKQLAGVVCRVVGLLAGERVVPSSVVARDAVRVVQVVRDSGVDMVSVVSGLLYR